jgi:hypothetical protein
MNDLGGMGDEIERACFEQLTGQLKAAGEWVWTRGWQKDPPSFKSVRLASERLLNAYPGVTSVLTMRFAVLRMLREMALDRGLTMLFPVKGGSEVLKVDRSALFDASGVRIRESLPIHPPPPGSTIYTGPVDLVVTACLGFNPEERRLYTSPNESSGFILEEWREGLPNGFRVPRRVPVVAIAADQQQVTDWPAVMQSFMQADYVFTPTRTIRLGNGNRHNAGTTH